MAVDGGARDLPSSPCGARAAETIRRRRDDPGDCQYARFVPGLRALLTFDPT